MDSPKCPHALGRGNSSSRFFSGHSINARHFSPQISGLDTPACSRILQRCWSIANNFTCIAQLSGVHRDASTGKSCPLAMGFRTSQFPNAGTMSHMSGKPGDLNGSTQHSRRTRLALKTKAKSLARVRSAGTLPWLAFDRVQPKGSLLPGKHCRINALDGVASTG
jgi:hypothetical protein